MGAPKKIPTPVLHDRRDSSGRYADSDPCEACGKPAGADYMSDDETLRLVGLGLTLCARKRCESKRNKLDAAGRITLYQKKGL